MVRARALLFFGVGSSGIWPGTRPTRFSLLGLSAQASSDPSELYFRASTAGPHDVAVGLSHSGRSLATVRALELARGGRRSPWALPMTCAPRCTRCRTTSSAPRSRTRVTVTALSSRVAQLCIIDAMYLLAARLRGAPRDYQQVNRRMESLLRLPERR